MDKEKRRAVACKSCHALKVKCKASDPSNPHSACIRCMKTGRNCEFEPPVTRKRKKPEDRVAELELKLQNLTNQLKTQKAGCSPLTDASTGGTAGVSTPFQGLNNSDQLDAMFGSNTLHELSNAMTASNEIRLTRMRRSYVDVVQSGLISLEEAQLRYQLYQTVLYTRYPFVKISLEFEQLRHEYPTLFLTVIASTAAIRDNTCGVSVETNIELVNLAQQQIIDEVLLAGNKTMELLKSTLVWTLCYNTPEMFHHRRYHIFGSLCVSLCFDLGLTGRPYYVVDRHDGSFQRTRVLEEPRKDEYRCLVLTVYCLTTSFALFLRRRLIVQWAPYLEDCVQVLISSKDSRNRTVAIFAKITSLMEKIDNVVQTNDQVNYHLVKQLISELNSYKSIEINIDEAVMQAYMSSIEAFLYSKFGTVEMSLKCLQSCSNAIEMFSSLSTDVMVSIPLIISGRMIYCFALFLKTVNFLKTEVDLSLVKSLLDALERCYIKYPNSHLVLKVRLLLYFYLTTFLKNGDIFNKINEVSGIESIEKNFAGPAFGGKPTDDSQLAKNITNMATQPSEPPRQQQLSPSSHAPVQPLGQQQVHGINAQPVNVQLRPQPSQPSEGPQGPQDPHGPHGPHGPQELYPTEYNTNMPFRLDMLSDAATKGFDGSELLPTDDFWRMFDYKVDDQFYL